MEIRPTTDDDIDGVVATTRAAFDAVDREHNREVQVWDDDGLARFAARLRHFRSTDPERQWVAVDGGEVVGVASAELREGFWSLALLAVRPGLRGAGTGRALIDRALATFEERGAICASEDPRALRRYASAGFALHPVISAEGTPDLAGYVPDRHVHDGADADFAAAVDRQVRGASHGPDHDFVLTQASAFALRYEDGDRRGYAWANEAAGHVQLVAGTDEVAAQALLWAVVARAGAGAGKVAMSQTTGQQQWAVEVMVATRLAMKLDGAVCWRGMQPPRAYLPSGAYL